jgi:hypothetical protein
MTARDREDKFEDIIKPSVLDNVIAESPWRICLDDTFIGVYSSAELISYLHLLSQYFSSLPFELSLSSGSHSVSLCFCPTKKEWLYFDTKGYSIGVFKADDDAKKLAETLNKSLHGNPETIFCTRIKCIASLKNQLLEKLSELKMDVEWGEIHQLFLFKVQSKNRDGISALYIAAQEGNLEVVKILLDYGVLAEVNQDRRNIATPLYMAAQNGHSEVVKILLASGAAVNQATLNGVTPLVVAAQEGHLEVIKILLASGAAVNQARRVDGVTPLFMAAQNGHLEVVYVLLAHGADVNQADKYGVNPLGIAILKGNLEMVMALLEGGALSYQVENGYDPLQVAKSFHGQDHPIVKLLMQFSAKEQTTQSSNRVIL